MQWRYENRILISIEFLSTSPLSYYYYMYHICTKMFRQYGMNDINMSVDGCCWQKGTYTNQMIFHLDNIMSMIKFAFLRNSFGISLIFPHYRHTNNNDHRKAEMIKIEKKGWESDWYVMYVIHHTHSFYFYTCPHNEREESSVSVKHFDKSMNGKVLQIMASYSKMEQPKTANDKQLPNLYRRRIRQRQEHLFMLSTAKYLFLLFNCSNGPLIVQTNRKSVRIAFNQYHFGMDPNSERIENPLLLVTEKRKITSSLIKRERADR